jgi:hypothetical protein
VWLFCPPANIHDCGGYLEILLTVWLLTGEISGSAWFPTGFSFFFSNLLGLPDAGTEQTVRTGQEPVTVSYKHSNKPLGSIKNGNSLIT